MAFQVDLCRNNSENNSVTKSIQLITTLTGELKEGTSIISPSFLFDVDFSAVSSCNYIVCDTFRRKYFVNNISLDITGLVRFDCHVDVLSSFAAEIKLNRGIVRRQEKRDTFNLYINDNSLVAYQNPYVLTEPFPAGFTGASFVMIIAGGSAGE